MIPMSARSPAAVTNLRAHRDNVSRNFGYFERAAFVFSAARTLGRIIAHAPRWGQSDAGTIAAVSRLPSLLPPSRSPDMFRLLALAALVATVSATCAGAVELQTNFHYGEQVGFPPMEVPTAIYGGWGTPGWNCNAMGKVPVQPGLPAMYPTGCNPTGCNYCDGVWAGYQQRAFHKRVNTRWYYGNHRALPVGGPGPMVESDVPYAAVPEGEVIEEGTSSVVRPQSTQPRFAPTPAKANELNPTDDRPVPRTTNSTSKPMFRRGA
jgi:hypothetical protein